MASVVLAACPFRGHVGPTVALARALVAAGHRVRVLTGRRYAADVTAVGAHHVPLPKAADLDDRDLLATFPERADLRGLAAARFDMTRIFLDPLPHQLRALDETDAAERIDVAVAEPLFMGALALTTRQRSQRPPVLTLGTMPLTIPSRQVPPGGPGFTPVERPWGPWVHRAETVALHGLFAGVQRHALQRLAEAGCRPPVTFFADWPAVSEGILQLTVPSMEFPRTDAAVPVRFVGSLDEPGHPPAPSTLPEWWGDLDSARAVVHVTQGTAANLDLDQLLVPTAEALAERDVLVVATTGGRPLGDLAGRLPANARVAAHLPYDVLLPRTDVMVTNGGYGGVQQALRHGIPLVVAGAQQDKADVAARVRWSGTGLTTTTQSPSRAWLDRAVGTVLHDPSFADAAARVRAEFAAAPGATGAVHVIESLLR